MLKHIITVTFLGSPPGWETVFDVFTMVKPGFPLRLENLENLEKWEGIFQSGKSQGIFNRLEKSGKSQGKSHKILEKLGNLK